MQQSLNYKWEQTSLWVLVGEDKEADHITHSHAHRQYELFYMYEGEIEYVLEGHKISVKSDSLIIIPSNTFHYWIYPARKYHRRFSLHFCPELFDEAEEEMIKHMLPFFLYLPNRLRFDFNAFFQSLSDCKKLPVNMQKTSVRNLVVSFITQAYFFSLKETEKPMVINERIQKIVLYINANLRQEITMDILADKFAITKNYLSSLFLKVIGVPVMKYINVKRLELIRNDIIAGANISEAALNAGFNDYSTFYRAYKSTYGHSPSKLMTICPIDSIWKT